MADKPSNPDKMRRYILTGAAIGLYFGWFFRPGTREPSLVTVLFLTTIITIVVTLLRLWQKDRENLLQRTARTFINYALILAILEARHLVLDWGGRWAVIAMTTIMGMLSGWWLAQKT